MKSRFPFRPGRALRLAAIAGAAGLFCLYLDHYPRVFDALERMAYHEREAVDAELRGQAHQIVLVVLSDKSVDPHNRGSVPLRPGSGGQDKGRVPRDVHARVVRELTRAGAKVIAFDIVFDEPRPEDAALAEAARQSGRVVWAGTYERVRTEDRVTPPTEQLLRASPCWGHTEIRADSDTAPLEWIQPGILWRGEYVPAFSLEVARRSLDLSSRSMQPVGNTWRCGGLFVPTQKDGFFRVQFPGPPGRAFDQVAYEEVYRGLADKNRFQNKIVLIGDTRTYQDSHETPTGTMHGLEINAAAVDTLLKQDFIPEAPDAANAAILLLLSALACPLASLPRLRWAVLGLALLPPAYYVANVTIFVYQSIALSVAAPTAAVLLASAGLLIERGLTEEREKSRMRALLRRYVSSPIAEYVIAHPERCILGGKGERVTATVLFSDIRGFTALSGTMEPEQLVALLNEYFQAMTDIIFRHDGTVARIAGDAIMALFGVPVPHDDHARRAVATALDMQAGLAALQASWRAHDRPVFDIGIGINTGEMVAGNVGALERMEFTVYGPPVNIASRVEALNKEFGTRILITGTTYRLAADAVTVREPRSAHVKGVDEPLTVYEVIGPGCPAREGAQ